jgi:formylglycine-generating enzyme required for sulfatase activity
VATLYRVGQSADFAYLVWELVRGQSLDRHVRPVAPDTAMRIARDIARGLAAAHRRGVLHRDIKPGNVVLTDAGEAKLVDFGLAALMASEDSQRATSDELVGTPYFRAPETWRGELADVRTDLYSFGVILYELLAGDGPFRHLTVKELRTVVPTEPARPLKAVVPAVPESLAAIVDRCLKIAREDRFATAEDVLAALELASPGRSGGAVPEGNPYRGLRAYDAEHRALFFGRARPLQLAIERMRAEPMLVVIGDSGVGKSSLCAAGIVPAVAEGALEDSRRWLVARMVPGKAPVRALSDALANLIAMPAQELARAIEKDPSALARQTRTTLKGEHGLLLYVDQMEELVTQAASEASVVAEALAVLADGLPGVRVLGTARSDFLSRLAALPGLAAKLPPALMLLAPMAPADVREAIAGPAILKGTKFESEDLVDDLVRSAQTAQGSLPLLQFTLAELWERRDRTKNEMTAASLASLGGVAGALGRHADAVVVGLSPEERTIARAVLLRLVTIDDTRARRTHDELLAISPLVPKVLEALVRGRLLVASESPDGATYEIAHEALVGGWTTLAGWLAEEVELRALRHRLEASAAEWHRRDKRRDLLWSGGQLAELDARSVSGLSARETDFVEASRRARKIARWVRRGALAGAVIAVAASFGIAELRQRAETRHAVDADLTSAQRQLDIARNAATARASERRQAFAAWDAMNADVAEGHWRKAREWTDKARRAYAETATMLEHALVRDPRHDKVRARYADLLFERAQLAEDDHRIEEAEELAHRLALYDTARAKRLAGSATVESATPFELVRYDGTARTITKPTEVEPGAWIARAGATQLPLLLQRGERRRIVLDPPPQIPDDFIYMPAGDALFGTTEPEALRLWSNAVGSHVVQTDAFLIARHETTFAQYIEFLDDITPEERSKRRPHVASVTTGVRGTIDLERDASGRWTLAMQPTTVPIRVAWGEPIRYRDRDRRIEQDWRKMPVAGISFDDASAYAAWLDRTGRVPGARLCNEYEWERAARGTSDRRFPHGDQLAPDDANIDITYDKQPAAFGPDEVGSHPATRSIFGVDDLTGNVWEWVASNVKKGQVVARGGSYYFAADTARITNREIPEVSYRGLTVGIRICASTRGRK